MSLVVRLFVVLVLCACAQFTSAIAPRWEYNFQTPQAAVNPFILYDVALVPTNTTLYAFNTNTGKLLWTFSYPNGDLGGYSAADADVVVVGTLNAVYALSLTTGQLQWQFSAPSGTRPQPWNHFRPSLGAKGVYVTTGYTPLLKLDKLTGTVLWTADSALGVAQLHATEYQDFVYVVSAIGSTEYALCLTAANAVYQWNVTGVVTIIVSPALGLLFSQGGNATVGTLTASSLIGGAQKYQLSFNGLPSVDYYVFNTTLYVDLAAGAVVYPNQILKYDGATGTAQWSTQGISFLFFVPCSKGIVNFGPDFATAYEADTGLEKWRYRATAVNDGAATENNIIVMITDKSVVALDF